MDTQHQQYDVGERDDAPVTASKTADPDRKLLAEAVTINRPARELYDFWRRPENLVQVMDNIVSIEPNRGWSASSASSIAPRPSYGAITARRSCKGNSTHMYGLTKRGR